MGLFNHRKKFKPTEQDLVDMERLKQDEAQMKAKMPPEIVAAHEHCHNNRSEINKSETCGCFYCLRTFPASSVDEWVISGTTATCPHCGIDAVLGDVAGFELTQDFLNKMHSYWFG